MLVMVGGRTDVDYSHYKYPHYCSSIGQLTRFLHFLQIYNETVRNLLGPSSAGLLDLREDAHGATIVSGLTELEVKDSEEVMTLLHRGNLRRTCEPTAVNKTSSRSHAILKVKGWELLKVCMLC